MERSCERGRQEKLTFPAQYGVKKSWLDLGENPLFPRFSQDDSRLQCKPADVIIQAYQDLRLALQGIKDPTNARQMQALEQIQEQLSPGNKMQIEQQLQRRLPRVQNTTIMQRLTEKATHSPPRVQFEEPKEPPRMIVA